MTPTTPDIAPDTMPDTMPNPTSALGPDPGRLPPPRSFDELRAQLLQAHGVGVGADDPILLAYTLHRVALEEVAETLATARGDLSAAVRDASTEYAVSLRAALDALLSDSTRQRLLAMQEAAVQADRAVLALRRTQRWLAFLSALTVIAALVSLAVLTATLV
ncbi:hypothetical protein [Roseospira visakhapatnamensis]|uniref:Transcriptional activator TraM n=1 Tax=Roseospira visakhapatnamensis TaxID=390880 RepID=A0A7W6RGM9_9PROT|nr:hypothetical protein [Roseospira visakhapatnamensis]MBB4267631.1 hypothetical protein [Roseospira visakhapatnamensis]